MTQDKIIGEGKARRAITKISREVDLPSYMTKIFTKDRARKSSAVEVAAAVARLHYSKIEEIITRMSMSKAVDRTNTLQIELFHNQAEVTRETLRAKAHSPEIRL